MISLYIENRTGASVTRLLSLQSDPCMHRLLAKIYYEAEINAGKMEIAYGRMR
jgi:hypothetical protein